MKFILYFAIISLGLTVSQFIIHTENSDNIFKVKGNYSKNLVALDSKTKVIEYIDSIVPNNMDTIKKIYTIDQTVRNRFYHGTARYTYQENYAAYLLGLLWADFNMITSPNDLFKKKALVCNQSSIIVQNLLNHYGYKHRSVGFNKHFASEVFYNKSWHLIDCDYEPKFIIDSNSINAKKLISDHKTLINYYSHVELKKYNNNYKDFVNTKNLSYGYTKPGNKLANLQSFLWLWSWFGGIFTIIIYFILKLRIKKKNNGYS